MVGTDCTITIQKHGRLRSDPRGCETEAGSTSLYDWLELDGQTYGGGGCCPWQAGTGCDVDLPGLEGRYVVSGDTIKFKSNNNDERKGFKLCLELSSYWSIGGTGCELASDADNAPGKCFQTVDFSDSVQYSNNAACSVTALASGELNVVAFETEGTSPDCCW